MVDEAALRARARAYREGLAARWPRSRVVFASKSFPCTAVQRVMVEEGLGLDVAGGGEIMTALAAGADPASLVLHGNAKLDDEVALAVESGLGTVVVDNTDDIDRLETYVPSGRRQDVLVRVIPEVTADTHAHVLHGPGRLEVRALVRRCRRGHPTHRGQPTPAAARDPLPRGVADPRRRTVRGRRRVDRPARRVRRLRPRRWAGRPLHLLRPSPTLDAYLDATVEAVRAHLPAESEVILEPGRSMVATQRHDALPGRHRQARETDLRGRRRRDGRQPRGCALPAALRGCLGEPCRGWRRRHGGRAALRVGGRPRGRRAPARRPSWRPAGCPATGAYCYTMSNNYNGARRIPVVFVRDGSARPVVRRETWADMLARDLPRPHTDQSHTDS